MDIFTIQEEAYKRGYEAGVKSVTDNNVGGKMTPTADRERLIEILRVPIYPHELADPAEVVADYLLDNGVTFAKDINAPSKWIPVTERLPEKEGTYIVYTVSGCVTTARFYPERDFCNYRGEFIRHELGRFHRNSTHWMPLPEPPKGE